MSRAVNSTRQQVPRVHRRCDIGFHYPTRGPTRAAARQHGGAETTTVAIEVKTGDPWPRVRYRTEQRRQQRVCEYISALARVCNRYDPGLCECLCATILAGGTVACRSGRMLFVGLYCWSVARQDITVTMGWNGGCSDSGVD